MTPDRPATVMCAITCKCGHSAGLDEFKRGPGGTELPPERYRCPACRVTWEIRAKGKPRIGWSGMVIPAAASVDDLHSLWQQWKSIIERNPDKRLIMDAFARRKAELMGRNVKGHE